MTHFKNGFHSDEVKAFTDMLFVDTMRGWDATGVFGVDNKQNVAMLKEASDGPTFIRRKEFSDFCKDAVQRGVIMVGHNRAATKGDATKDANAHPFNVDNKIVLVQNGTYHGDWTHHAKTEVDTEAIAHVLAKESDIPKALQSVNAAYALVWYDVEKSTLHLIRNSQRPLWVAKPKRGGIIFASEPTTIMYAAARQQIPLESAPNELEAGRLVSIKLAEDGSWQMTDEKIDYTFKGFFRGQADNEDQAYDAYMSSVVRYNQSWNNHRQHQHHPSFNKKLNTSVDYTFREIAMAKPVYHKTKEQMESARIWGRGKLDKPLYVELLDFHPANGQDNCKSFFVTAKMLDPHLSDTDLPFAYWIVQDKDEVQMIDMFNEIYWTGKGSNFIQCPPILNKQTGEHICLAYMFLANPIPAAILEAGLVQ